MFLQPTELNVGEAYIYNDFDIEGDIEAVFPLGDHIMDERWGKMAQVRYGKRLLSLPKTSPLRPGDAPKLRGHANPKNVISKPSSFNTTAPIHFMRSGWINIL